VTITRPDGTVEVQAPQKAVRDVPKPRRKKPATGPKPLPLPTMKQLLTVECPACGRKADEPCTIRQGHRARVELYRAAKGQRSTPEKVAAAVQKGAEVQEAKLAARRQPLTAEERAKRAAQSEAGKDANRRKGSKGNPYKSANTRAVPPALVKARRCPRCGAAPGESCDAQSRDGSAALHLERVQDARRELQAKLDA
jgi:transcription elongation factor Elf1